MARDFSGHCFDHLMKYLFFLICIICNRLFACEVVDDKGNHLKLDQPAMRVISLAPDITENIFAIGAGAQLVGVVKGSDYPPPAKKIPIVATVSHVDMESLLRLKPDLVIAWTDTRFADQLKKANIPIFWNRPLRLMDVPNTLKRLGCLLGHEKNAEMLAVDYTKRFETLQKKYQNALPVSVFYQVWSHPLITISEKSWIHDVIRVCGGKNVFSNLKGAAPVIALEPVLIANPDIIIGTNSQANWQNDWKKWPKIKAVKNNYLFSVDPDKIERATPRLLEGAEEICNAIEKVRHRE